MTREPTAAPTDIATCMYYTGIEPFSKKPVNTAKNLNDRKLQRALMQFFKPENYFEVREALIKANRADLIGGQGVRTISALKIEDFQNSEARD